MARCPLCNNFERKPRDYRVAFDFSAQELNASATAGCVICSLLNDGLTHFSPKIGGMTDEHHIHVWGGNLEGGGSVEMEIYASGALKMALEFFFASNSASPIRGMKTLPTVPGNTASEESMVWVRGMLKNCTESHSSCNKEEIPNLPTRVLEIGSGEEPRTKLLCSPNTKARYACLSHCWGNSRAIVTETQTLDSHIQGIKWKSLPQTFQEAISIARRVGLRYLWIDSLCIIQDDVDDWRKQSAQMASIYQNSHITIAATKSSHDSGGCYSERSIFHKDYRLKLKARPQDPIYVREKILHFGDQHCPTPLLNRAWVYQERLLAPRIVHFCEREIVWECQQSVRCECSCLKPAMQLKTGYINVLNHHRLQEGVSIAALEDLRNPLYPIKPVLDTFQAISCEVGKVTREKHQPETFHIQHKLLDPQKRDAVDDCGAMTRPTRSIRAMAGRYWGGRSISGCEISKEKSPKRTPDEEGGIFTIVVNNPVIAMWRRIVTDYSGLHLTKESDRLPAIAGVARQVGDCLVGRYLAGTWECALPNDLLWRVEEVLDIGSQQQSAKYTAPSWSWASVKGKVVYPHEDLRDNHFEILSVGCTPVSNVDPFGEVRYGFLQVRAHITPATVVRTEIDNKSAPIRFAKIMVDGGLGTLIADSDIRTRDFDKVFTVGNFATDEYTVSLLVRQVKGQGVYQRIGLVKRTHPDFASKVRATVSIIEADALGVIDRRVKVTIV